MEIIFSPQSFQDLQFWKQSGNVKIPNRIKRLLNKVASTRKIILFKFFLMSNTNFTLTFSSSPSKRGWGEAK